jgi:hypothetical protein
LSDADAKAEHTLLPESIALGVFGATAAVALLIIAGQAVARRLRSDEEAFAVLRALGAEPATTVVDGLIGALAAVLAGSFLAVLVAVGVSSLAPLGPARPYVANGLNLDWTVLGGGFAILAVLLGAIAVATAVRTAPYKHSVRQAHSGGNGSSVARAAASAGFPLPFVTGMRFALEPGAAGNRVPVRSAILGAVLAVVVVVSTVTFGASLRALVTPSPLRVELDL